ncbi:hypothetical protein ACVWWO_000125 [Bradyrhizobium sp. F1.13.1]
MMTINFMTAAFITVGLAVAPLAAEGESYAYVRHDISTMQSAAYGTSGLSIPPSGTYADIRNVCRNCHRTLGGVVQLAFGRRDKRSAHLAQHQSFCSQVARTAATSRSSLRRRAPPPTPIYSLSLPRETEL